MKYLLLTLEYPPLKGGVGHYYSHLVKYWPSEHTPAFGHPSQEGNIKVVDNSNKKLVDETRSFLKWWPAVGILKSELKNPADNYVLVGHLLPLGTVAWLLSFFYDFKYCVFLHGYDLSLGWSQPRKRWLIKAILNRADKIIAANSYTEAQVKKILNLSFRPERSGVEESLRGGTKDTAKGSLGAARDDSENKVARVNPGIEGETVVYDERKVEALRHKYNLAGKTVLLTITRLVERKGVDMALEGLKLALKGAPELFYVIIGFGQDEARIRQKIADLGLESNTLVLTDDSDKMSWYKLADIFIMTARQIGADVEGFGIVYLEAGLAGKPVIAGRSGGVPDAVVDNVNGLLVNPTDAEAIEEAIVKLAKYPNLRHRLGDEGRRRALTMFNWRGQAEKIYNHISHNT